jgi:site-specific recombinase XerD
MSDAIASCLQGLSPSSARMYSARLTGYFTWLRGEPVTRESVRLYLAYLSDTSSGPATLNQALAAIKRWASEAGELGAIPVSDAASISRIRSQQLMGARTGHWIDAHALERLMSLPDRATARGRRDAALLALLAGCGLRRAEACGLETAQLRRTGTGTTSRLLLADVRGKRGRVRTIQVPLWAEQDLYALQTEPADAHAHNRRVLVSVRTNGTTGKALSTGAVRKIVRHYGVLLGVPELNPHDLRRSLARAARRAGAPLETIQHTLGHASVRTTEIYTKTGEEANAGDWLTVSRS